MFALLFLGIVAAVLLTAALGVLAFIYATFRGQAPETASLHPPEQSQPQLEETLLQPTDETTVSLSACSGDAAAVRRGRTFRKQLLLLIDVFLVLSVIPFGVGVLLA